MLMLTANGNSGNNVSNITSNIRELLGIWKETFFYLFNKKLWLVSLKTALGTYQVLFYQFWWLIALCLGIQLLVWNYLFLNLTSYLWLLSWTFMALIIFLLIRASLCKKDYNYFRSFIKANYIFFIIITTGFLTCWEFLWLSYMEGSYWAILLLYFLVVPLFCIYTFFYLDTISIRLKIKRMGSALLFLFYTFPYVMIIVLATIILYLISIFMLVLCMYASKYFEIIWWFYPLMSSLFTLADAFFAPIFLSFINTIYTKQVHDHYDLYALQ